METLKFDNTLIEVKNYPICFVNAKLNLFNDFFKGTWKIRFEARTKKDGSQQTPLKQAEFEQTHLHSSNIKDLIDFLNDVETQLEETVNIESKKLEQELYEDADHFNKHCPVLQQTLQNAKTDLQFVKDLLKQLPPIQEKDVWFLFQKPVDKSHPPLLCSFDLDPDIEKQIDEELNIKPEYSHNTY